MEEEIRKLCPGGFKLFKLAAVAAVTALEISPLKRK